MQTQYALKQAGLNLPVTKEFQQHITTLLANQVLQKITEAVVINFRDPDYSAESGGIHPVEIRFIRKNNEWYFDYVTDFGNDSNLLIVFYVQIMPDDLVMQLHRF
uniref:DUF2787 family protein n=1 Tax=Escherichia coli TaxID=562 RepID=UPI003C6D1707